MKGLGFILSTSVAFIATTSLANVLSPRASIKPVTVKGNAFFAGNERFYIRGVDYQPGGSSKLVDPLADLEVCKRDVEKFKKLKINTVRIYSVDNSKDHSECMKELADAGIYLALDVNTPKYSIRQDKPAESYNSLYLQNIFATIDEFHQYDNTLLFFSGNEVINDVATTKAAKWVKAVTRDIKQYIGTRGYRAIPVGYSGADIDKNGAETAEYFNCGTDDARVDFFAFNDYSWCNPSDFKQSTWERKVNTFKDYSVPIFLSEYGCTETDRSFAEIGTLYSDLMTPVYSGGLVYEYTEEGDAKQSKFGLVQIKGGKAVEKPDFSTLMDAFSKTPAPKGDGGYKPSGAASTCPAKSEHFLQGDEGLPGLPKSAAAFYMDGAGPGVGFEGTGSQDVGDESSGTATPGSGKVTATATGAGSKSTKKGDAGHLRAPSMPTASFVCGLVVLTFSFFGASLL